jgi:hypothetical protein
MTVNTFSREVSTFKSFQAQKATSYQYMKKQFINARHWQSVALKLTETLFFFKCIKKKQDPGYILIACFSNT